MSLIRSFLSVGLLLLAVSGYAEELMAEEILPEESMIDDIHLCFETWAQVITIVDCLGTGSKKQISQFSNTLLVESFIFHSVSLI